MTKTLKKNEAKSTAAKSVKAKKPVDESKRIRYGTPLSKLVVGDRVRALGIFITDTGESAWLQDREVVIAHGTDSPSLAIGDSDDVFTHITQITMSPKKKYPIAKVIDFRNEKPEGGHFIVAFVLGRAGEPINIPMKTQEEHHARTSELLRNWYGIPVIGLHPSRPAYVVHKSTDNDLVMFITYASTGNLIVLATVKPNAYLTSPAIVSVIATATAYDLFLLRDAANSIQRIREAA